MTHTQAGLLSELQNHRHIVRVMRTESLESCKSAELVMEVANGDLFDWIMQHQDEISEEKACELFGQILSGVSHAHERGIFHG